MREAHDFVLDDLRSRQDVIAVTLRLHNAGSNFFRPFLVENIVWMRNNATVDEHKNYFRQLGPYRITSFEYSFWLEHVETKTTRRTHYDHGKS